MAGRVGVYIATLLTLNRFSTPQINPSFNTVHILTILLHPLIRRNGTVVALTNLRRGEKVIKESKADIGLIRI